MIYPTIHIRTFDVVIDGLDQLEIDALTGLKAIETIENNQRPNYSAETRDRLLDEFKAKGKPIPEEGIMNLLSFLGGLEEDVADDDLDRQLLKQAEIRMRNALIRQARAGNLYPSKGYVILPETYFERVMIEKEHPSDYAYNALLNLIEDKKYNWILEGNPPTNTKNVVTFYTATVWVNGQQHCFVDYDEDGEIIPVTNIMAHTTTADTKLWFTLHIDPSELVNDTTINPAIQAGSNKRVMGFPPQPPRPGHTP